MANPQHGFFASVFKSNRKLKYSSFEKRKKSVRMGKSLKHRTRTNNNANSHIVDPRFNDPLYHEVLDMRNDKYCLARQKLQ